MAESTQRTPGRVFISYRRQDTQWPAGRIHDRLEQHLGRGAVFTDVDSIRPGDDFVEVINDAVGSCDVLLALIGKQWLKGEDGRRRIDDPDDFVRLEIEAALARKVGVIPILVDGAERPRVEELPASLAQLVRHQTLEVRPDRFNADVNALLKVLDAFLTGAKSTQRAGYMAEALREWRSIRPGESSSGLERFLRDSLPLDGRQLVGDQAAVPPEPGPPPTVIEKIHSRSELEGRIRSYGPDKIWSCQFCRLDVLGSDLPRHLNERHPRPMDRLTSEPYRLAIPGPGSPLAILPENFKQEVSRGNPEDLVPCPRCHAPTRRKNLIRHFNKAHQSQ